MNGFVAAAIGFSLVDLMNRSERISFSLSPLFCGAGRFLRQHDHRRDVGVL
ncbi:MAG: hypothetical protein V8T10_05985 [Merdibacter sp.]